MAVRVTVQIINPRKISTEALAEVDIIFLRVDNLFRHPAMCYLFYYTEQNCNMLYIWGPN